MIGGRHCRAATRVAFASLAVAVAMVPVATRRLEAQTPPTGSPPVGAPAAGVAQGTRTSRTRWARVTYRSGESIYLDAGTTAGLREQSVVDIVRGDSVVASLSVQFVSSSRASARLTRGGEVVVGDSARFVPADEPPVLAAATVTAAVGTTSADSAAPAASSNATAGGTPRRRAPRTVTGRMGFRYLHMQTGDGSNGLVTQPALDFRLEGHGMDGTPIGVVVDARAHRQQTGSGRTTGSTRVYQSLLEYQGSGTVPVRVIVGRQLATTLSPLGFFDGVTVDLDRRNWRVGALGGTQPDFVSFKPSTAIREGGAWVQWHTAPGSHTIFNTTVGAVGSYGADGINREFALLSTMLVTPVVSLYATQELDVNRGWRKSAESGHALTPTSTFATLRIAVTRALSVNGGYDNRRNVRLYRDFLTPDVAFDDEYRRGYWGGLAVSVPHLYASIDARTSEGLTLGRNQSNTASLSLTRLTPLRLGIRARGTSYNGPTVSGTLTSASLEADPFGRVRVEATFGRRDDRRAQNEMLPVRTTWVGLDADAGIGRSWYFMVSTYREVGETDRLLQQYIGLSYRF
jgi:hypothetical protein